VDFQVSGRFGNRNLLVEYQLHASRLNSTASGAFFKKMKPGFLQKPGF